MQTKISENVLRRLLVSKQFLASATGHLTPTSDQAAVAKMILTAHDAAELAAAAIADHLRVPGLTGEAFLMNYPSKISNHVPDKGEFPGTSFLKQLNTARKDFKHVGILPDSRTWYRVIDNTWDYVKSWCRLYLEIDLDDIDLHDLLENDSIKNIYEQAKDLFAQGSYQQALEQLAIAVYWILEEFPGIRFPLLGKRRPDDALMLSAYGVRASDFLSLQEFLPEVELQTDTSLRVRWNPRETGHPGNWTERNVRFCLETFIDIALKIQHAPWHPQPVPFYAVFDDLIRARHDGVELWRNKAGAPLPTMDAGEREVVMRLDQGQTIRGVIRPQENRLGSLASILGARKEVEEAEIILILSEEIPGSVACVETKDVEISYLPKDSDTVRKYFPHILTEGQPPEGGPVPRADS